MGPPAVHAWSESTTPSASRHFLFPITRLQPTDTVAETVLSSVSTLPSIPAAGVRCAELCCLPGETSSFRTRFLQERCLTVRLQHYGVNKGPKLLTAIMEPELLLVLSPGPLMPFILSVMILRILGANGSVVISHHACTIQVNRPVKACLSIKHAYCPCFPLFLCLIKHY